MDKRFEVILKESNGVTGPSITVLVDKVTGVQYLLAKTGYGAGLTPLLDAEEKPVIQSKG